MINDNNIDKLLQDYFRGTLSPEDGKLVDEWICESSENRKKAEEYCRLEYILSNLDAPDSNESEAALKRVHSGIRRHSMNRFWTNVQSFAALLSFPLLLVTAWLVAGHFKAEKATEVSVKALPGLTANLELPDGSTVWLNSNSTLTYPSVFGSTREVTLEGEGYFKVAKDKGRKFTVHAANTRIEVRGTEFNVEAYSEYSNEVRTSLLNGSVKFFCPGSDGREIGFDLKPGEQYIYDSASKRIGQSSFDYGCISAWKEGRIVLLNTSLEDALRIIGNRFNVHFLVRNPKLLKNRYTGTFTEQRLEVVLEHFRRTTNIHFDYDFGGSSTGTISGRQNIIVY